MERPPLLILHEHGLYCAAGGFHVDAWGPVDRNIITHAHADHAHAGSAHYLAAAPGRALLSLRLGDDADIQTLAYGQPLRIGDVTVSLHPAGHILGSAQVRVEHRGEVWVVSGDYKLAPDPTCAAFEPVRCHTKKIALCLLESAAECSAAKGDLLVIADDAEAHPVVRHFFVQDDCSVVIVAASNLEYATVSTCAGLQREESHLLIHGTDCQEDMAIEFTCH